MVDGLDSSVEHLRLRARDLSRSAVDRSDWRRSSRVPSARTPFLGSSFYAHGSRDGPSQRSLVERSEFYVASILRGN